VIYPATAIALGSIAVPSSAAPIALKDVIAAFNQTDNVALDQISDPATTIEVSDSNDALKAPEILSYAQFRDRVGNCKASAFQKDLFLSCPTQPPGADKCTHYAYQVRVEFGERARFVKAWRAVERSYGCVAPVVVGSSERG
jgi:hypothetical protein